MISFRPLTPSDRGMFEEYLNINRFINSEYCFTTLFAWRQPFEIRCALVEGCLCVRGVLDGEEYFYFPLGTKDNIRRALPALIEYSKQCGRRLMFSVSGQMLAYMAEFGLDARFTREELRDYYDYVYKRDSLISLGGKKLHGKRNHFNYFAANYSYSMTDITADNADACRLLLKTAIEERSENKEDELAVTLDAFDYRDELKLTGSALYVNGRATGVILAENLYGMAVIQIAKADVNIRGASVALFKLFLEEHFADCEDVNFMDDMGYEGMRKAKLSYAPDRFVEKYMLTLI